MDNENKKMNNILKFYKNSKMLDMLVNAVLVILLIILIMVLYGNTKCMNKLIK